MSSIKIRCIKYNDMKEEEFHEKDKYHKDYQKEKHIDKNIELEIISSQLFMNTTNFFETVKESLEKYFDEIVEKK